MVMTVTSNEYKIVLSNIFWANFRSRARACDFKVIQAWLQDCLILFNQLKSNHVEISINFGAETPFLDFRNLIHPPHPRLDQLLALDLRDLIAELCGSWRFHVHFE
jgi:hypothetical protein